MQARLASVAHRVQAISGVLACRLCCYHVAQCVCAKACHVHCEVNLCGGGRALGKTVHAGMLCLSCALDARLLLGFF
jgi:hypothetical protein